MEVKKENIFFSLRIIFCVSLVAIWAIWLTNSPQTKIKQNKQIQDVTQEESSIVEEKEEVPRFAIKPQVTSHKPRVTSHEPQVTIILPKLAKLTPEIKKAKTQTEKQNEEKKSEANINLSNITSATRKALMSQGETTTSEKPKLREKAHVDKTKFKTAESVLETNPSEGWLPKYSQESNKSRPETNNALNNSDDIASQLILVGLIQNPNETGAAIIKNKATNKVEILKKGEEYQGLKLIEINNNEVILGNENLNKRYIKKIENQ